MLLQTLRNATFTILVLVLAAVGISWNNNVIKDHRASLASNMAVAGTTLKTSAQLPLEIDIPQPHLRVSQTFEMVVNTKAYASLEIKLISPRPNIEPIARKGQADKDGEYVFLQQMDSYDFVGRVIVEIVATWKNNESSTANSFLLDTWGRSLTEEIPEQKYVYPLLP